MPESGPDTSRRTDATPAEDASQGRVWAAEVPPAAPAARRGAPPDPLIVGCAHHVVLSGAELGHVMGGNG